MKKSLILATVVIALAYTVALFVRFAGYSTITLLSAPAVVGGVFAGGLLLMAFSDYSRKPRFRGPSARKATPQAATPATSSEADAAPAWTYTPFSA